MASCHAVIALSALLAGVGTVAVGGQPSTVFLSKEASSTTLVFENRTHDFPQRVGYERTGRDTLLAWIEGIDRGQARRVEFPYHRVAWPA
jgi:hypothetical protein